jgi:hypothetical protein
MHFKWQPNIGIAVIRDSDGMDYHPTKDDFRASNFATRVRKSMSANYRNRIEARKAAKIAASQRAMFERQSATTRVTLHDSRVAGNCIEGTLSFAERKLGLTREEVLRAGHLFSVPASQLLRVANGDAERVEAAIKVAWMRETMVQI